MTETEVLELVRHAGLSRRADELGAQLQASIRIEADTAPEAEIGRGASKFGGTPDLPAGTQWPELEGRPLAFIGQLRLSDIAPYDADGLLPHSGVLSFFYDASEQPWGFQVSDWGGWRVLYHEVDPALLEPRPAPPDLGSEDTLRPCTLRFSRDVTLPPFRSLQVDALGLSDEERGAYVDLELRLIPEARGGERVPVHRMLGHGDAIQGDMQLECQTVSHGLDAGTMDDYRHPLVEELKKEVMGWKLLLQVDSDDAPGWMWGDSGRIYYWIHMDALLARDFDNAWVVLQCY